MAGKNIIIHILTIDQSCFYRFGIFIFFFLFGNFAFLININLYWFHDNVSVFENPYGFHFGCLNKQQAFIQNIIIYLIPRYKRAFRLIWVILHRHCSYARPSFKIILSLWSLFCWFFLPYWVELEQKFQRNDGHVLTLFF